jgi:hypothetical protein
MTPRKEPTSPGEKEKEIELLRLKLEVATMREEIQTLRAIHNEQMEALKENARLFQKLKPSRDTIRLSSERKMLIAGQQLFRCAAPHGREKCPCWLLNEGSFGESGFEIDHELPWSKGYTHTGQLRAVCALCHSLLSRLQRIEAAEKGEKGEEEEEE